jgi:5-dehydro-4-deoxyglucarate dehydratase
MTSADVRNRFRGVFGFPITPFRQDLSPDLDGLARNVDQMSRHPFCGLVAAGGTGELYSMTASEIADVVRVTVEAAAGRMPVVAGVGLFDYYEAIARASQLPLMVYSRDWAVFSPQMVARLAERLPSLAAWKDGQGDVRKYQRIMSYVGDRLAWFGGIGDDCVPGYFAIGVQAYTSSISNIAPKLSLQLAEAGLARDFARLDDLMRRYVHPLYVIRDRMRGYEVALMKQAMEILGMPAGPVRPPLTNCRPQDAEDIRKLMEVYRDVIEERESGDTAERSPAGAGRMSR